ncbi:hypothetical protein [Hymenobacter negativus]|uniref:Glycosyltransferase RgtA/B/C/D-like domain-containing protein n=1 Tax=Hymenobacter negativus TaxID=2795026 RepID=A0ABS0Q5W9_9BACT|nr:MULTISPECIES: hypothetical protein [Bacteria]MBH8557649.1 hypothetical protein [Hymenobacter negativus]MBH8567821.1 hypothetical protein [Hymenobacter negativus]MBR7207557.1 hypothetical protein [Microvirga sp. STS02]
MELKDLYITPFYLALIYGIAYGMRSSVTNVYTKKYFIPALTVKVVGAIALGILYHTLYGGDTNNYYKQASVVYHAFGDSFAAGLELVTSSGDITPAIAKYTGQLYWFGHGSNEYFVIRVAAVLALLSFDTYTVIAVLFAAITFSGMWMMYMTFAKIRPQVYKELAISVFFLPSVFFWGSGLLKDSLCLGALGWLFYCFYRGAIERKNILRCLLVGLLMGAVILSMKTYILLAFMPPALLWVFNENTRNIKSAAVRWVAKPLFLGVGAVVAVFAMSQLAAADERFNLDKIGEQSKVTADYLQRVSKTEQGSGYNIGAQDGTLGGMAKLAPQAIIVALFRPFLWEARNPTMLLSALEATYFLLLTMRIFWRVGFFKTIGAIGSVPVLTLCFVFSLIFAISVGISSGNFGTLVRYKIPLMPFYLSGLYILQSITVPQAAARAGQRRVAGVPRLAQA